jgi:hypothetical protein
MVARNPQLRRAERRQGIDEIMIGLDAGVLGQVAGAQYQVDVFLLLDYQVDDIAERIEGIEPVKNSLAVSKEV